jgi:hypothetical protein
MNSFLKTFKSKRVILIWILILTGVFLRFYNLNWGAPYYFHPDERNVVDLILRSSLAEFESLIKGTFAYGNFPVILALILKPLIQPFLLLFNITDQFTQTVVILRLISAASSAIMLFVIYQTGRFWSEKIGLIALFLSLFSVGFIQQAHFGTFDGLVAFCAITIFYFTLRYIATKNSLFFYLSLVFIAIGTASKVNLLVLAVFPFLTLLIINFKKKVKWHALLKHLSLGSLALISLIVIFSPNYLSKDFLNALMYERSLVVGTFPVFYTQSFSDTIPIVFQFLNILPFLINPLLAIIFIPTFFYILIKAIKTKNIPLLLLTTYFLLLFLPQAFLHAKWTRYMVPPLPFMYLILAITVSDFIQRIKKVFSIKYSALAILLCSSILFGISYFITTFTRPDTRIQAAEFVESNIPKNAIALSEPYDLGIMPFNRHVNNIRIFNFYDLEADTGPMQAELDAGIQTSDYVILPSQRLIRSRLLNKKQFPKGNAFYKSLINGRSGYEKIYQTPCDIFCKVAYLGDPVYRWEETATVFDRPTVFIFRKTQ